MSSLDKIVDDKRFFHSYFLVCGIMVFAEMTACSHYFMDEVEYITLQEAENKNLLKKNPTKEELLQAVLNNSNITEEFKLIFEKYIVFLCNKKEHIDKAVLLQNIKDIKEIKIIPKEEMKKTEGTFTTMCFKRYEKRIYIREDKYEKYKNYLEGIGSIRNRDDFESGLFHEITHLSNRLVIKDAFGRKSEIYFYEKQHDRVIMEQMTEDISRDIFDYLTSGNLYLYENMDWLKIIIGDEEYENVFYYDGIQGLREVLESRNENISVDRFLELSYEQQKIWEELAGVDDLDSIKKEELLSEKSDIDLELYKMYVDYFFSDANLPDYVDLVDFMNEKDDLIICEDVERELNNYLNDSLLEKVISKMKVK